MKKNKIIAGLFILSALCLTAGCSMGNNDKGSNNNSSSSGSSSDTGTKHQWTADGIEVTPNEAKYGYLDKILLAGDYTKADFKVCERDSNYTSETQAGWDGYSDQYNKDVVSETTISVNGEDKADGKFTIEGSKDYTIKFTYKNLSKELKVKGVKEGSIVTSSNEVKAIAGVKYGDVNTGYDRSFGIVTVEKRAGTTIYSSTVQIKDATTANGYSIFAGPGESSLTKISESSLMDYVFKDTDKLVKFYHENITDVSKATTGSYTMNLTITPISSIKNASATFKAVTKNKEIGLLEVLTEKSLVTAYNGTDSKTDNRVGQMKMADKDAAGTIKVRDPFTLEIYDNKELTGTPVAKINKNTTAADKWTPGEGADYTTYSISSYNGDKTYTPKTSKVYYVKIIYNDGTNTLSSSNVEKTYDGTSYKYYPFASIINVTE